MPSTRLHFDGPSHAAHTVVLAHGAGRGLDTPALEAITVGLAARDVRVVRFEFPYMRKARETGRRRPPNSSAISEAG